MINRRAFLALPALAALPGPKGLLGPVTETVTFDFESLAPRRVTPYTAEEVMELMMLYARHSFGIREEP